MGGSHDRARARCHGQGRRFVDTGDRQLFLQIWIQDLTLGEIDEPRWMSIPDCDYAHPMPRSRPRLEPGVQLPAFGDYSQLHLFQLFFSKRLMTMLIQDTNKFNDERKARENKCYRWKHVTSPEFKFFIAIFMGLVNVPPP